MLVDEILEHAKGESPQESCGLIIVFKGREIYKPCRNVSEKPLKSFLVHPEDYAAAEDYGEITKIVHSHPCSSAEPSQTDLTNLEKLGIPWIIVNPITGKITETNPSGYKAPLVGREYTFGVLDCFTLVQDYYLETFNISIPDVPRIEQWWEKGEDYIQDNYLKFGFKKVDDLQKNDLVVTAAGSKIPNHLGVYLGDGHILQHNTGRLSSRDTYGNAGYWYKHTWGYLRHIDLF